MKKNAVKRMPIWKSGVNLLGRAPRADDEGHEAAINVSVATQIAHQADEDECQLGVHKRSLGQKVRLVSTFLCLSC